MARIEVIANRIKLKKEGLDKLIKELVVYTCPLYKPCVFTVSSHWKAKLEEIGQLLLNHKLFNDFEAAQGIYRLTNVAVTLQENPLMAEEVVYLIDSIMTKAESSIVENEAGQSFIRIMQESRPKGEFMGVSYSKPAMAAIQKLSESYERGCDPEVSKRILRAVAITAAMDTSPQIAEAALVFITREAPQLLDAILKSRREIGLPIPKKQSSEKSSDRIRYQRYF